MKTTGSFNLGLTYKDKITGAKGIATGYVQYITGCNQVLLAHECEKESNKILTTWIDESRLEQVGNKEIFLDEKKVKKTSGFDTAAPAR